MKILAIETSTEACSCALVCADHRFTRHEVAQRKHAELILSMVDDVLTQANVTLVSLDGLAFGRGPGSFTGVRIATAVIQGLAFGADLRVAPVSSLRALAQGVWRHHGHQSVFAAFDARMAEVYWGRFECAGGIMEPRGEELVAKPNSIICDDVSPQVVGAGSAWASYPVELEASIGFAPCELFPEALPDALDVAVIGQRMFERGETVLAEEALPVYLRDRVTAI